MTASRLDRPRVMARVGRLARSDRIDLVEDEVVWLTGCSSRNRTVFRSTTCAGLPGGEPGGMGSATFRRATFFATRFKSAMASSTTTPMATRRQSLVWPRWSRRGHPDPSAFDPSSDKHDPKSRADAPTWFQVTIRAVRPVKPILTLPALRLVEELAAMELLRKGSRLSIQPVRDGEWSVILGLVDSVPA